MKAFTFSLVARYPDGATRPLTGEVGAPVAADPRPRAAAASALGAGDPVSREFPPGLDSYKANERKRTAANSNEPERTPTKPNEPQRASHEAKRTPTKRNDADMNPAEALRAPLAPPACAAGVGSVKVRPVQACTRSSAG